MFKEVIGDCYTGYKVELNQIEEILMSKKYRFITFTGFESLNEAQEFASKFPKYVKVTSNECVGWIDNKRYVDYHVGFKVSWATTKVTGKENEQSIKRINGFIKTLKKMELIK